MGFFKIFQMIWKYGILYTIRILVFKDGSQCFINTIRILLTMITWWFYVARLRLKLIRPKLHRLLHILRKIVRSFVHESGMRSRQKSISVKSSSLRGGPHITCQACMFSFNNHQHTKTFNTRKATKNHLAVLQFFSYTKSFSSTIHCIQNSIHSTVGNAISLLLLLPNSKLLIGRYKASWQFDYLH